MLYIIIINVVQHTIFLICSKTPILFFFQEQYNFYHMTFYVYIHFNDIDGHFPHHINTYPQTKKSTIYAHKIDHKFRN